MTSKEIGKGKDGWKDQGKAEFMNKWKHKEPMKEMKKDTEEWKGYGFKWTRIERKKKDWRIKVEEGGKMNGWKQDGWKKGRNHEWMKKKENGRVDELKECESMKDYHR